MAVEGFGSALQNFTGENPLILLLGLVKTHYYLLTDFP